MDKDRINRQISILEGMKVFPGIPNVPRTLSRLLKANKQEHPERTTEEIIDLTIMQLQMGVAYDNRSI